MVRFGTLSLVLAGAAVSRAQFDCFTAPTDPQDRRVNKDNLRVATYNVEWLFDGRTSQGPRDTPEEAQRHLEEIARVSADIDADIIAIQEVQNCDMLQRLCDELALRGVSGYKPYLVRGTDTGTLQNVGMITRVDPVQDVRRTSDRVTYPVPGTNCGGSNSGTSAVSKHMEARFDIPGLGPVAMLTFHFLAFPTDGNRCRQREAQATVIRQLINAAEDSGHAILALGDFNDYSDQVRDSDNNVPNSRVMRIIREGTITEDGNVTMSKFGPLVEPVASVTQSRRFTAAYGNNQVSSIDHLIMSPSLSARMTDFYIDNQAYPRFEVSDHWAIVTDISTRVTDEEIQAVLAQE